MNVVDAVKDLSVVNTIPILLNKQNGKQMSDIWNFGVNVALRITDLLNIKLTDIEGDRLTLIETKTKKKANILLNSKALEIVNSVRSRSPEDTYLFQSKRSRNMKNKAPKPLSRQAVTKAFTEVGETIGIPLGTHSMRKTRGYHLYKQTNDIARVMKMLRHSSAGVTLHYIGITQDDIDKDFNDLVL
jgi:integrase